MKFDLFKLLQFVSILIISVCAGIKYDSVVGMIVWVALTILLDIQEAIEKGHKK